MRRLAAVLAMTVALGGCGFHLRGNHTAAMPESLKRLRVEVSDSKLAYEPLRMIVANALQADAGVTVTDDPRAAVLVLSNETIGIDVVATNVAGRASAYTMRYDVRYRVIEPGGRVLVPGQRVRLLRDYTFDPVNVLAKEREEQDLKRAMQQEAAQHILRRLSRPGALAESADAARP